jgi:hypothetical protein
MERLGAIIQFEIAEHAAHFQIALLAGEAVAIVRAVSEIIF